MHEYLVELRIYGKGLYPAEITEEMNLQPSMVWHPGDTVGARTISDGLWAYNGSESGEPIRWNSLEEGLSFVMNKFDDAASLLKSYQSKYEIVFWCGHFQSSFDGGPLLSSELLTKLAQFGVPVFIDNYFSDDGEGASTDLEGVPSPH